MIQDEVVERKPVRLGATVEGRMQVLDGLTEGEEVVFQSQGRLADGSRVSIRTGP